MQVQLSKLLDDSALNGVFANRTLPTLEMKNLLLM